MDIACKVLVFSLLSITSALSCTPKEFGEDMTSNDSNDDEEAGPKTDDSSQNDADIGNPAGGDARTESSTVSLTSNPDAANINVTGVIDAGPSSDDADVPLAADAVALTDGGPPRSDTDDSNSSDLTTSAEEPTAPPIGEPLEVVWFDDFESGFGDWFVEGGDWSIGEPTVSSNRPTPHSGEAVAGTGLNAYYGANRDARLISPVLNIPAASTRPRLRFHYWHAFHTIADYGQLQIRVVDGEWQDIARLDQDAQFWRQAFVDLSAFESQDVELGFRIITDATNNSATGLFVDDVSLETGRLRFQDPEDFESGWGDWSVEGGAWAIGVPTVSSNRPLAHSGSSAAGTGINDYYGSDRDARLVSPEYLVPDTMERPELRYWIWFSFHSDGDFGQLQVRRFGGVWEDVADGLFEQDDQNWTQKRLDLRPYSGNYVQFSFRVQTDGTNNSATGLFIDDVSIATN